MISNCQLGRDAAVRLIASPSSNGKTGHCDATNGKLGTAIDAVNAIHSMLVNFIAMELGTRCSQLKPWSFERDLSMEMARVWLGITVDGTSGGALSAKCVSAG